MPDFPPLAQQAEIAQRLLAADPAHFHFATTFSMQGFEGPQWTTATIEHIDTEVARRAGRYGTDLTEEEPNAA